MMPFGSETIISLRHMWLNCILHVKICFNVDTAVLLFCV